jgi:capsule polysaccharide export protein KpsE/RkpR
MSSNGTKPAAELLREVEIEELLTRRLQRDRQENRSKRIARIGRLWESRRVLLKFAAWGAVLTAVIAILIPSQYESITRLMPPDPPQGQGVAMLASVVGRMSGSLGGLGGLGSELLGVKNSGDLFVAVLFSRTVQDDLINKFDLRRIYGVKRWVDARKQLTQRTEVAIERKSGVLTICVTDHDPKRANAMAQEYVAQLNNVVNQLNTSAAHRERVFLQERIAQVKDELESAEKEFSQFASSNATIDIKEQGKAMVEAAAALEGELIATETELQGLRQIYTDYNVRVRTAQARVNELNRQIQKLGGKPGFAAAAGDTKDGDLYPSIRKLPLLGVTYADLYRKTKVEETVFEILTQQYELAKVQEAKEIPSAKVLDPPDIPEKKVFPPRTIMTIVGTFFALVLGAFWVLGKHNWEKTDPEDPGKVLVLNMVRSVQPQLEYVVQQRATTFTRTKRFVSRFAREVAPAETKPSPGE